MTIEAPATYISQLNSSYPEGGADRSTADDHLRLIKSTIKASFPGITGAMTATHTELNLNVGNTRTIGARLVQYSLSISQVKSSISSINTDITKFSLSISALNTALTAAESKFSLSISAINTVNTTQTNDIARISTTVVNLWAAHNATSASVQTAQTDIARLSLSVSAINTDITRFSLSISAINTRVNTLSVSVATVQTDVARLSLSVSAINTDITKFSLSISAIGTSLAAKVDDDVGAGGIGMMALLFLPTEGGAIASASTYAGSSLRFPALFAGTDNAVGHVAGSATTPGGNWRALHGSAGISGAYPMVMFQRVS